MSFELLLIGFIAAVTPGPDILLIIHTTINNSAKAALKLLSGILSGNIIMIIIVFFGFSSLGNSVYFQIFVSFFGAIYLLYTAKNIFKNRKKEIKSSSLNINSLYKKGLFVNISNPKAIIFFSAVLSPFIDRNSLVSNLTSLFIGIILAFLVVIFATSYLRQNILKPRTFMIINTVSSCVFFVFSIELFRYSYCKFIELI